MKENTPADGVKRSVNLVELIRGKGVSLKKVGKTFVGLCPFHKEKKPSFTVDPVKSLWHCFGCDRGGDVFTFLQELEGLSFRQALGELSGTGRAAASGNGGGNGGSHFEPRPAGAHPLLGRVLDFYHQTFYDDTRGLSYLRDKRKLHDKEIYDSFRIGFANGSLFRMIPKSGEVLDTLQALGIITSNGREFFHERVIIPISNEDGEIVGLYGRSINDASPVPHLYLSGPHRGVFNWQAAKRSKELFLTESIIDALSIYQAGCRDVIPLYGTKGLTPDHLALFRKYRTKKIFLALDSDRAGEEACQTIAEALFPAECVRVVFPVKDANDFFREHTGDDFKALCDQALPIVMKKAAGNSENPEQHTEQAAKEILDDGFSLSFERISYRVKLIHSYDDRLRVTIKALCDNLTFLDTVDLYSHKSRQSIINQLSKKFSLSRETVERHILSVLDETETFIDERARRSRDSSASSPQPPPMSANDKDEAMAFLTSSNIVKEILSDMEVLGYVGEPSGKLLAYLISISRKLDRPLSGIISSSSGAGKSHLAELVESLTPPEDVILFSRLSPQALGYMEKDFLKRKLLIIEERKGSEAADYSIRTLQSRQKLTQGVVIKDPATGRMQTKTYTVEGPIAYLETTTDGEVNPENSTRCFELFLDESPEQTEKVQAAQRTSRTRDGLSRADRAQQIVKKHQNAQRLLDMMNVVIPYAPLLRFPSKWLRTRRDNERFLCLIEAICFLHQHQRERHTSDESGFELSYIEATVEDYRLAYELAKDVLSHTLHDLRKHARELLGEIVAMAGEKATETQREPHEVLFSRREIREFVNWSDRKVRECLMQLVDLEYILFMGGSQGKACHYQLPESVPKMEFSIQGLTSPAELEEKLLCSSVCS